MRLRSVSRFRDKLIIDKIVSTEKNVRKYKNESAKITSKHRKLIENVSINPILSIQNKLRDNKPNKLRVKKKVVQKLKSLDPYDFSNLDISDDDKENIVPNFDKIISHHFTTVQSATQQIETKVGRSLKHKVAKKPKINRLPMSDRPIVIKKPIANKINSEQIKHLQATILLPMPRDSLNSDKYLFSKTPLSTIRPQVASTPAIVTPISYHEKIEKKEMVHEVESIGFVTEQLSHQPATHSSLSSLSLKSVSDVNNSSKDKSGSSGRSGENRISKEETRHKAYSSWLEEFNAQMDMFNSHELSIQQDS